MESAPVVFDISSDEEGWGENKGIAEGSRESGDFDNLDWLSELFEVEAKDSDDSDDVVVVGEVLQNPKQREKSKPSVKGMDGDDDDCVILDGDPDKTGAMEKDDTTACDSDDLVIVGEKGQIACRDYPHSRHLCATFPFASTSHESHCQQCHCYVCDTVAPCVHWGNGISRIHHCHATDKDEFWKLQRKNFRQGGTVPVPRLPDPSLSIRPNPNFRVPAVNSPQANTPTLIHISRSTTIRACSTANNLGVPNTSQGRSQQPGQVMSRNKYQPFLVSRQLNNVSRSDRRPHVSSLGPRNSSHPIFKRAGSPMVVGLATNRPTYGSSTNATSQSYQNAAYQQVGSFSNPVPYNLHTPSYVNIDGSVVGPAASSHSQMPAFAAVSAAPSHQVSSQPTMSTGFGSSMPSLSHVSQPNMPVSSQPQVPPLPRMRINLYSSTSSQPQIPPLPNSGNIVLSSPPSQPQVSSQPNTGPNFVNPMSSQFQAAPQPNMESSFLSQEPLQPQLYGQTMPEGDYYAPQNAPDPRFSDGSGGGGWEPYVVDTNQETLRDNQSTEQICHPPFATDFEPQTTPADANPNPLEFQYDTSWVVDNHSGAFDVTSASGLNMYSPELDPISMGGNFFI